MRFKNFIYYKIRKMSITKTYTEKSEDEVHDETVSYFTEIIYMETVRLARPQHEWGYIWDFNLQLYRDEINIHIFN